jgi:beta-glucosidase
VGYKWYDSQGIEPLYPFGYGLSYTTFGYGQLAVAPVADGRTGIAVSFTVRNTGSRPGTATPSVYLTLPAAAGEPGKRLVGFDRLTLAPGQARRVVMFIDPEGPEHPLSYWDTTGHAWATAPGWYQIQVGGSSRDAALTGSFQVG